jgi:thiamine biosynthesis lipoprotein
MKLVHVRRDCNHMATTFRFTLSCDERRADAASRVLAEAHARVAELEDALSEFRPASPVHALNRAPAGTRVRLEPEGLELLERGERLRALTRGAFDCAAKSASRPAGAAVAWDRASGEAWRLGEGVRIGFGAIGKGYALDEVRLLIEREGFGDYLLSAGGSSVLLSGFAGPGDPWRWGWSWARDADGDPVGLALAHGTGATIALGVSGTHEKGEHLLDPRAARPAAPRALSTLVCAPSAADADALSTALFVAGYDEASEFLSGVPYSPGMAQIGADGHASWNGIFRHYWGALATAALLTGLVALAPARAMADAPAPPASAPVAVGAADPAAATPSAAAAPDPAQAGAQAPVSAPPAAGSAPAPADDGAVDLAGMGAGTVAPYVNERNPAWGLLPAFALFIVLIHLKKTRRKIVKKSNATQLILVTALLWGMTEQARAVDLIPLNKALEGALGTSKAFRKTIGDATFFYSKDAAGRPARLAFIEHNTWQKSCSHTWVVGIDRAGRVVRVIAQEQQCPHAKPSAADSFLDQYKGKSPADAAKLRDSVNTIAKATGSCELATDAVTHVLNTYTRIKGQL